MDWKAILDEVVRVDIKALGSRVDQRLTRHLATTREFLQVRFDLAQAARIERKLGPFNYKKTPIVINSFNRVHCLKKLIDWLERAEMTNIIILDNGSEFPPLLDLYRKTPYRVVYLDQNIGSLALWKSDLYNEIKDNYYVYTDPDVIPVEDCPRDAVAQFHAILKRHPRVGKVGFGLKIDDLPTCYDRARDVVAWEQHFWTQEIEPGVFDADVDTTFALYRPRVRGAHWMPALRTGAPLIARHVPWYANSSAPDEEELFYRQAVLHESSHWMTGKSIVRK